jgi:hypothetical protein
MARSPLTDTITRVQGMITYVRENLSDEEWNLFLDLVAPETVAPPKTTRKRKATKKPASTNGNSRRGLPHAGPRCVFMMNDGEPCTDGEHSPIHKESFGDSWHSFTPAAPTIAPRAHGQSSRNGQRATCSQCGADVNDSAHVDAERDDFHLFTMSVAPDNAAATTASGG